jgi:hypothetical protein
MIAVDVNNEHDEWHQWWHNFRAYYIAQGVDMDNEDEITRVLAEWNAIDKDQDSSLFYFESEQDYVWFMLRWA